MKTTQTTTPVIDLPKMVKEAIDTVEFSSVRLTACLRGINRLRTVITDNSVECNSLQEIFDAADEMELMIEKAVSVIDEFYNPTLDALVKTNQFLEAQFSNC